MRASRFFSTYRLPILAGLFIGTSYIPFPPWALFFCQAPLFLFWSRLTLDEPTDAAGRMSNAKRAFVGGWITQFVLNLIGFHWVGYTTVEFGHFPIWFGALVLIAFAAIAHLQYPIAGWLAYRLMKRFPVSRGQTFLVYAVTFALVQRFYPMIFPWHLGYPWLWATFPGAQFSDVIGFEGLDYVTILTNALIAWALSEGLFRWKPRALRVAGAAVALVLAVNIAGIGRATPWKNTDDEVNILAVQGNIGNFDKLRVELHREFGRPVVAKYLELTRRGLAEFPSTNLVIWPETAFPHLLDSPFRGEELAVQVRSFVRETKMPLLAGSYSADANLRDTFNGVFFVDTETGFSVPPYRKSILLVFGETFPFSEYIDYMSFFFPDQGSFGRGQGPTVMPLRIAPEGRELRLGPQICYEGLYPWFSSALARDGAQIFANVTNDSWFGWPFEPHQHGWMTLARAVEFRRPLMRATNTGISTAILATGEILQRGPHGEEWAGGFRIPFHKNPAHTMYEKFGYLWPWILVFSLVILLFFRRSRPAGISNE